MIRLKLKLRWLWKRWSEKLVMAVTWLLPRRIAYWATIRVIAHVTQGAYSQQVVPELTAMDALKRWETA